MIKDKLYVKKDENFEEVKDFNSSTKNQQSSLNNDLINMYNN